MKRTATKYAVSKRKSRLRRINARANARGGGGVGTSTAPKKKPANLQDYSGDPIKFLKDFLTGGAFRE